MDDVAERMRAPLLSIALRIVIFFLCDKVLSVILDFILGSFLGSNKLNELMV